MLLLLNTREHFRTSNKIVVYKLMCFVEPLNPYRVNIFVHHEYFVFKILWKPYTYLTQTGAIGNCGSQGCMEELKQHPKEMLFKIEFGESARQMCWVQQIAVLLMWRCL